MGGTAWVTLATNDSYSLGALVLAHSLQKVNTIHKLAVLITPAVSTAMREQLSSVFDVVKVVDVLDSKDEANLALLKRRELGITFTKLHCWTLTDFDKGVFLDADTLVVRNSDELFERDEFSAAPDVGWPDCFNSGVFVFRPSNETFTQLIQFALEKGSFDGGDQGLLNQFFSSWATDDIRKHLPFIYNLTSVAVYSYIPAFKQYGSETRIVHFIGPVKPWLQPVDSSTRTVNPAPESSHLQPLLQQWWDIFIEKVHPNLSAKLPGIAGAIAQLSLDSSASSSAPADVAAQTEYLRRQSWETGKMDYMGRDSFANIWSKISETLAQETVPELSCISRPLSRTPSPTPTRPISLSMILDSDSIDTLPCDTAMSPVEVADDDVIFDRRRSLELRSEPPSSLPGIIEEEEPPLMGEEDLCDVVESVTFSSMSVSNGSAATNEPKADLACLSTPVSASDVVTEQTPCYPTDIDVPPSDQRTDQNAPPPVPSNVPGFVPPFVECKKDFSETATFPVTNATCVSEGTCEEDVLSVISAVSNPVTSKQEIINVEKTGPSMDGITATSPELSDNLAGDSFVTPPLIVDLNGAVSETNENALQRVEPLRVTSDFGQPMKEDLEKCHEQGILDVFELDSQERQENTECEICSIPTDQAIGELEISTFQEDVTNVLPVGDTIMVETLLAGEEATSDDPPITKGEEILAEEPTNLSEGVEVSPTDPVKSETEENPLDLSGAQEGSIPVDESKNPPPECGDVSSIPSSDSVSAFAVYKPLKSQETTTGQPSSPERQTSVEEKPVNKGVFTKLLEFVGVKKKDEPMVATSVFYDTPETVIEATESTDEIGQAAVDTGDVEGIADVLNAGDLSALGSSTESPKRSPSPRIDIPAVPTTRLIEATPPTSPGHKPPRRDSEALTVDNFIPETPPVVEKKTSVNIEHEILDSSLVQKEIDEIISKAKLIASDQVDEDPVYSNILVSTPSTSQEAAKPPIALCEDFEEIHVTPQNERGRPRESVSSKLAGQILKAIPPPRRRAISDSRQTKVEVTLEKSLRVVHEMPGSGSPSSSSASPHSSLTSPVEESSGPPPVPPRRRRSQQRQEPQPPPKRKPKK